jgi:hypothetical protein
VLGIVVNRLLDSRSRRPDNERDLSASYRAPRE